MSHTGTIKIDPAICIECGLCVTDCVRDALRLQPGAGVAVNERRCFKCGHCIAICPVGAATLDAPEQTEVLPYDADTFSLSPERFLNALKFRRSIRQFTDAPVDAAQIAQIIEAGRYTPTGTNRQDVSYIVLDKQVEYFEKASLADCEAERRPGMRQEWVDEYMPGATLVPGRFFRGAKVVVCIVSDNPINGALAACSMELMANALGLGAVYGGLFMRAVNHSPALMAELGIVPPAQMVTCLCLGHHAVKYHRTVPRNPAHVLWL